jgi:hypothetical protein
MKSLNTHLKEPGEFVGWTLLAVLGVLSVLAFYLLWAKVSG